MNKKLILSALIMLGTISPAYAACCAQNSCSQNSNQTESRSPASVPEALASLTFIQGEPNTKAKYYIYLHTANRCCYCSEAMPSIVKAYPAMKKAGVEIILLGHESSEASVKQYAQKHHVQFPALLHSKSLEGVLPGYQSCYNIPGFVVVDKNGNELHCGHPSAFFSKNVWRAYVRMWNDDAAYPDSNAPSTISSADDMDKMLTNMATKLAVVRHFQSNLSRPGSLVGKTLAGIDNINCYGLACCGNRYAIMPWYSDATRILYAFRHNLSRSSSSNSCAGTGISAKELKALKIMRERLKDLVNDDMTPEQIVLAIHDDLINRASYSCCGDSYSATGMILNDTGACNAYALYMYVALNMVGIPCHRVVGCGCFNHAWNLVKLNGEWYHLDATWDDPTCCTGQDILRHTYFCVSDETMSRDHQWDRSIYPASAQTDLMYTGGSSSYTTSEDCVKAIETASSGSHHTFEGRASFITNSTDFAKTLANIASESGAGCPVSSYVLDPSTGNFIVNFGSPDTGVVPEELKLEKNPVESAESAAQWINVESAELNEKAQEALQKFLSPGSKTWDEFIKESKDALTPEK